MTDEIKMALFRQMLIFESKASIQTYDHCDYNEMANGAFEMLTILGLDREYIRWADGKELFR